jgi:hypothetical protein
MHSLEENVLLDITELDLEKWIELVKLGFSGCVSWWMLQILW